MRTTIHGNTYELVHCWLPKQCMTFYDNRLIPLAKFSGCLIRVRNITSGKTWYHLPDEYLQWQQQLLAKDIESMETAA